MSVRCQIRTRRGVERINIVDSVTAIIIGPLGPPSI